MASLYNQTQNFQICGHLIAAENFKTRSIGLLGRQSLDEDTTMYFPNCNSVHTFFMRFPIDVIFVDKQFVVQKVVNNLKPWRLAVANWKTRHTFEFKSGVVSQLKIAKGDQLRVVD